MSEQAYLMFAVNDRRYGIQAEYVREVFFIPTIHEIMSDSPYVVGVINLRGNLMPVMDLSQRLGLGSHQFTVQDPIIVVTVGATAIAIVVSQVFDVSFLTPHNSKEQDNSGIGDAIAAANPLVAGVTQWRHEVVTLLNASVLVSGATGGMASAWGAANRSCFPDATPAELEMLQRRAESLREASNVDLASHLIPLAVVGLQGEQFALPVEYIREFTPIRQVTPIPCCPSHIVGNMNLRGEILTLLDIQQVLQLTPGTTTTRTKAVVVNVQDVIAGIIVDAVHEVMYVQPSTINTIPVASHNLSEEYLRGMIDFQNQQVSVLDLKKLLSGHELVVNEVV